MPDPSTILVYVPTGDDEFRQAVVRAFPWNTVEVDPNLPAEHIRIGGGPVLPPEHHGIRQPARQI